MTMRLKLLITLPLILMSAVSAASGQKKEAIDSTSKRATLSLCDLIHEASLYDGKEVKFRATYLSTLEHSAFVDGKCTDKDHSTWVEFDFEKIRASTKPEILDKVEAQIFCCMYAGLEYFRTTNMVVTGLFVSSPNQGLAYGKYGHDSMYTFLIKVRGVTEIEPTKTIKVPGFDPRP
jgi:hypothetical protein